MEWNRRNQVIAASFLVVVTIIIFSLSGDSEPEELPPEGPSTPKVVVDSVAEKKEEANLENDKGEVDLNLQNQFNQLIGSIQEDVSNCQAGISKLFPEDRKPNEPLPYQTVPEIKQAIDEFYGLVGQKIQSTQQVIHFFRSNKYQSLNPKETFQQLSQIEDCGDFEEESIIDSVIYYISDYTFTPEEKKDVVRHILRNFKDQLKLEVGLHHIVSKVESLESLVEEGLLPLYTKEEINRLQQTLNLAEEDFKRMLPPGLNNSDYIAPKDVLALKEKEDEILERVKSSFNETLGQIEQGL